jgi:hypothetical protein
MCTKTRIFVLTGLLLLFSAAAFPQKRAAKPKVSEELAEKAFNDYRFEEAVLQFETLLENPKLNDSTAVVLGERLDKARIGQRMMRGTEDIVFIDSLQIDKANLPAAIPLDEQNGTVFPTGFLGERGILKYFAEKNKDGNQDLFTSAHLPNGWEEAQPLSERINTPANESFPFVSSDGITLYFASDGEESLGGYDIFMSRFQPSANDFLQPENMGMPFNSPFNDYWLVIDEAQGIGYFASDRYQPEGKATLYTFIPNDFKKIFEGENQDTLQAKASLRKVNLQPDKRPAAKQQQPVAAEISTQPAFDFWVNDTTVYHNLYDFKSDAAQNFYRQAQAEEKKLTEMRAQLETLRREYDETEDRAVISNQIITLEKAVETQRKKPLDFYRQAQEVEKNKIAGL